MFSISSATVSALRAALTAELTSLSIDVRAFDVSRRRMGDVASLLSEPAGVTARRNRACDIAFLLDQEARASLDLDRATDAVNLAAAELETVMLDSGASTLRISYARDEHAAALLTYREMHTARKLAREALLG